MLPITLGYFPLVISGLKSKFWHWNTLKMALWVKKPFLECTKSWKPIVFGEWKCLFRERKNIQFPTVLCCGVCLTCQWLVGPAGMLHEWGEGSYYEKSFLTSQSATTSSPMSLGTCFSEDKREEASTIWPQVWPPQNVWMLRALLLQS